MIFSILLTAAIGAFLCFCGYRFLRVSMTLCGFLIGIILSHYICQFSLSFWTTIPTFWTYIFMLGFGLIIAGLSFKIYRAALFYITMLFCVVLLLRTYLSAMGNKNPLIVFFYTLFDHTGIGGMISDVTDTTITGENTVKTVITESMTHVWEENFWMVLGITLIVGMLAGFLVVLFQKPAIIISTSILGGYILMQSLFSYIHREHMSDMDVLRFLEYSIAQNAVGFQLIIVLILAILGISVQMKKAGRSG